MTEEFQNTYQDVKKKATAGMGWNYFSFGLGKTLNIATTAVLAHLLAPEYFGQVALATLAIEYLSVLSDLGLGSALVQRKNNINKAANIAFTLNLGVGIFLSFVSYIIAPYVANFFNEPQVVSILRWLGLTFFISAVGSVHRILLQKNLSFQKKIIPELGNISIKAIVSVGMAFAGFGVWSLVVGQIVGVSIAAILLWVLMPWRPEISWDNAIGKELFKFGFPIMGNNAITTWEENFDYFIIGLIYTSADLGVYTLAYRLPQALVLSILWTMTDVLFPTFSSLQDQKDKLKTAFLSVLKYVELLVTPLCLGMFIAADPLIRVLFGEQWIDAIPILRALSLYVWVVSIGYHVGDVYKAIGRPDLLLKISIPMFFIRIFLLWLGAQFSLVGVGVAHLVAGIFSATFRYFVAAHFLKITLKDIIRELSAFVCGVFLALFSLIAMYLTRYSSPVLQLIMIVFFGGVGYIGAVWFFERKSVNNLLSLINFRKN
ncbi:lipopolysaccharide biosynthesis protein [candidate division KSB1 bacterium]|nr:lipopolysaccharide biosynthesis protein [candidate division KSB1 bacterium]